jgi:uncharacterized cupin superfamily protein
MAKRGEQFPMPERSMHIVRRPAAESDGAFGEMDFVLPHGSVPPPPHVYPHQVEDDEVLEGALRVVIDGQWRTLAPGDRASVPVGALHTFRNHSVETVRVRNRHTPGDAV